MVNICKVLWSLVCLLASLLVCSFVWKYYFRRIIIEYSIFFWIFAYTLFMIDTYKFSMLDTSKVLYATRLFWRSKSTTLQCTYEFYVLFSFGVLFSRSLLIAIKPMWQLKHAKQFNSLSLGSFSGRKERYM